ncbi:MAG: NADH-quinone oxidoreductase subunit C [bacterium]|nr:NADH-quinone oxidoreductase subunit C [bacterium]
MSRADEVVKKLKESFHDAVVKVEKFRGEVSVTVDKNKIREIMFFLRDSSELLYGMLTDLCGVDYLGDAARFEIVYLLYSLKFNDRLRIKARIREDEAIDTVSDIWKAADWMEREVYDMFGVKFSNHPDLRRILMMDEFVGYPLRKDFPTEGYGFAEPLSVQLEEELDA